MKYRIVLKIAGSSRYEFFTDTLPAAQILLGILAGCSAVDGAEIWDGSRQISIFGN